MALNYDIYDVFTETKMAGNPLAVMYDADDLSQATMQAIAREMNLSETVFVNGSTNPAHAASLRIFTPSGELPLPAIRRWAPQSPSPSEIAARVMTTSIWSACWRRRWGRCVAR